MKKDYQARTWEVTLITPLHVGDGEKLHQDMDYISSKKGLQIIDLDMVLENLADNPKALSDMGRMEISQFIKNYGLSVQPKYTLKYQKKNVPNEVRRFLKDAYGRPYLAGSSLKGGIRTALWTTLDRSRLPSAANYRPFEKAVNALGGAPHTDFLRPLQISDSQGIEPDGNLRAEEIKFFNLRTGNNPGWKSFEGQDNPTKERHEEAVGIYVEALKPQTKLYVRAGLDQFLRSEPVRSLWQIPQANGLDSFEALARVVNVHSLAIAQSEKAFFSKYGATAASGVIGFYDGLIRGIEEAEKHAEMFILRLAWGSGWTGMTGGWISGDDLEAVRREKKLGRRGAPVFPKTRRLVMEGGVPCRPPGWVLVRPVADDLFYKASAPASRAVQVTEPLSEAVAEPEKKIETPPEPKAPPQKETWENCSLKWTPNDGMLTASQGSSKATVKGKDLVPEKYFKKLIKKKKAVIATVEVEQYGNAFRLLKIL